MRRMIALVLVCVMLCMLCGCSAQGQDYKEAMKYYNAQDYDQALPLFQALGDYEDSAQMVITCACKQAEALIAKRNLKEAVALLAEYYDAPEAQQLFCDTFLTEGTAYADLIQKAIESWGEYLPIWIKALNAVTAKTPAGKILDIPKVDQAAPQITAVQRSMEKANKIAALLKEAYTEQVLQVCDEEMQNLVNTFFQSAEIIDQQFQDLDSWVTLMLFYGVQDHNAAKANTKVMNALYAVQDALEFLTEHQG